MLILLLPLNSV